MAIKSKARKNVQMSEETVSFEVEVSAEKSQPVQDTDAASNAEASVEKNPSSSSHSQESGSESSAEETSKKTNPEEAEETESDDDIAIIKVVPPSVANRIRQTRSGRMVRGPVDQAPKVAEKTPAEAKSAEASGRKKKEKIQESASKKRKVHVAVEKPKKKKVKTVAETPKKKKKFVDEAPKPSEAESEEAEAVVTNAPGIWSSNRARSAGRRIPPNVPSAPIDNISFHSEECVMKWKYVFQRRVARERELGEEALKIEEIMDCIAAAGLMKTVSGIGRCFEKLVKEFIVNITPEVNVEGHPDYHKVYVRGKAVQFSPSFINRYLGREDKSEEEEVSLNNVAAELTAGEVKKWPIKGVLKSGLLTVKYAILNKIGAANWVPTNHTSSISALLAKVIYLVGTKGKLDFGSFIFDQTMKHASSFAIKIPIAFPSIISEIILLQHPSILQPDEVTMKKGSPLVFDERLYTGTHVPDIAAASVHRFAASSSEPPFADASTTTILAELIEISKSLQATIEASTLRKNRVDLLIKMLEEPEKKKTADEDDEDTEEDEVETENEEGEDEEGDDEEDDPSSDEDAE